MTITNPLMEQAKSWADNGQGLALATVVDTWGSSPCPPGSQMVVSSNADFAGSVSGGCIETSVVSECLEIIRDGGCEVLEYGVSDEQSAAAGLACGGTVRVLVEPLTKDLLDAIMAPRPFVRLVELEGGAWSLVQGGSASHDDSVSGASGLEDAVVTQAMASLSKERAEIFEHGGRSYFVHPFVKPYRMIIVGAVRIAQALVPMAVEAGFDVTVIDPRRAFITAERFPGVAMVRDWPDVALKDLNLDSHTALVTLTHDEKPDDMALVMALRSDVFYVGSLGSRTTHAKRVERLHLFGLSEDEIKRIHAPVGLDIGARTPPEIAVSILAQVVAAKNGK